MNLSNTLIDPDKEGDNNQDPALEQLYDGILLLAQSIVQQRSKFGALPLEDSATNPGAAEHGSVTIEALTEGRQNIKEAIALIKAASTPSSNQHPESKAPKIKLEEKRQQIRINVSAPINVMADNSSTSQKATLVNISWGGAAFQTEQAVGEVGDFIHIELPALKGQHISVQSQVLRIVDDQDKLTYNIRFSRLKTDDEKVFEQLLEFIAGSVDEPGQRTDARLAHRIEIQYDDINELQASLEDISAGGLGITVPEPMELNQSVLTVISSTDEKCQLALRARVVRQEEVDSLSFKIYRVGLEFEHPTDDLKDQVKNLIQKMASTKSENKFQLK